MVHTYHVYTKSATWGHYVKVSLKYGWIRHNPVYISIYVNFLLTGLFYYGNRKCPKFHIFSRFFDEFCQFDVFVNKSKTIEGRCFKLCIIIRLWRTHHSHCFVDLPGLCGCHGNGIFILFMCIHYNSLWANGSTLFSDSFWL